MQIVTILHKLSLKPHYSRILLGYKLCVVQSCGADAYILNKFFFSIFYINLALLFMYKNRNILVSILESYLFFIAIEIINEVLISDLIFYKVFHINIGYLLYILDCYSYAGINRLAYLFISSLIYQLFTFCFYLPIYVVCALCYLQLFCCF